MKLTWDQKGKRFYETGLSKGVLYPQDDKGLYPKGVAWNGLTSVTDSPEGAESTDLYADDIKYASFRSAETRNGTIEAYTYPDEFAECDGSAEVAPGVTIGQQTRKAFGLSYVTKIGNDVSDDVGYKIHLVYGATVSPSETQHETINDSPDAVAFSWDYETTPVEVPGYKPTATMTIDSTKVEADKLKKLEDALYGTEDKEANLPTPEEVIKMISAA